VKGPLWESLKIGRAIVNQMFCCRHVLHSLDCSEHLVGIVHDFVQAIQREHHPVVATLQSTVERPVMLALVGLIASSLPSQSLYDYNMDISAPVLPHVTSNAVARSTAENAPALRKDFIEVALPRLVVRVVPGND
jgi:hypothetical protein